MNETGFSDTACWITESTVVTSYAITEYALYKTPLRSVTNDLTTIEIAEAFFFCALLPLATTTIIASVITPIIPTVVTPIISAIITTIVAPIVATIIASIFITITDNE
ncbi:hypothetical protein Brsp01_19170 [Brucella sp. NBRC 12950]|nr:hypothetical protein Brsp01_19170 [Brucella sp. NBRC 12950]